MFSEELEKYSWEETTREIYSKTAADVELALSKSQLAIDDFMALISPAAEKYLEPMAALSQKYTLQRFGKTISMYICLRNKIAIVCRLTENFILVVLADISLSKALTLEYHILLYPKDFPDLQYNSHE